MNPAPENSLYFSASLRQIEQANAQAGLMVRAGAAAADWAVELLGTRTAPS